MIPQEKHHPVSKKKLSAALKHPTRHLKPKKKASNLKYLERGGLIQNPSGDMQKDFLQL